MKYFFVMLLLCFSIGAIGQDTLKSEPKRYIKIAAAPFLRFEAEWKQTKRKSRNLALNIYPSYNYFMGFKLQYSNRRYFGKKYRPFWAYHVGVGYIERVTQYYLNEKITYAGPPDVINETNEIDFKKHKWITAGIGTGFGWQFLLGKKKKWLLEGSAGIQYYYFYFKKPSPETESVANGGIKVKTWWTSETDDIWETTPWENTKTIFGSITQGTGTPFSILYGNLLIGYNF